MLIEFTVGNFRSFREPVTLSMEAAKINSEDPEIDRNNLIVREGQPNLLTSAAIYGANASGKSNLVKAMRFMRTFVLNSINEPQGGEILVESFRLSTITANQPSHFELVFMLNALKYRYGFEVTKEKVEREWLFFTPTIREAELFTREGSNIKFSSRFFKEGRGLEEKTRPNALFLTVVAQFNGKISNDIIQFFRNIRFVSGLSDYAYRYFTIEMYTESPVFQAAIKKLIGTLDLGIEDFAFEKKDLNQYSFPGIITAALKDDLLRASDELFDKQTSHVIYDADGQAAGVEKFNFEKNESDGTQKLFYLAGPVLDALNRGLILVVDEMEARMHPLITWVLISLFNSLDTNSDLKRAQIIFTTHDTNLLDRKLFRRDQIWFVEKDSTAASHLYSLVEFNVRNDVQFERNYLRGKYGAIPYLGNFAQALNETAQVAEEVGDGA